MENKKKNLKISILMAMIDEALPLIQNFNLIDVTNEKLNIFLNHTNDNNEINNNNNFNFQLYHGIYNDKIEINLFLLGQCPIYGVDNVGTVPAAILSFIICHMFKPDLLLNCGTAGGFSSRGAGIGDVYIGRAYINHDRRIGLPKFTEYGIHFLDGLNIDHLLEELNFKSGIISTGNSLEMIDVERDIMDEHGVHVKDMEAASIAWTCNNFRQPFISLKVVTDIVDGDKATAEEFMENLHRAAQSLNEAIPRLLDYFYEHELEHII